MASTLAAHLHRAAGSKQALPRCRPGAEGSDEWIASRRVCSLHLLHKTASHTARCSLGCMPANLSAASPATNGLSLSSSSRSLSSAASPVIAGGGGCSCLGSFLIGRSSMGQFGVFCTTICLAAWGMCRFVDAEYQWRICQGTQADTAKYKSQSENLQHDPRTNLFGVCGTPLIERRLVGQGTGRSACRKPSSFGLHVDHATHGNAKHEAERDRSHCRKTLQGAVQKQHVKATNDRPTAR